MPETQALASSGSWVSRGIRHKRTRQKKRTRQSMVLPEMRSVQVKYFDRRLSFLIWGIWEGFKEEVAFEVGLQE